MSRPRRKLPQSKRPLHADPYKYRKELKAVIATACERFDRFPDNANVLPQIAYRPGMKTMYRLGRIGVTKTLISLTSNMDTLTMREGYPDEETGKFYSYTKATLAKRGEEGEKRFQRHCRTLRDDEHHPAYLKVHPVAKLLPSGRHIGFAAVRVMTLTPFKQINLFRELVQARVKAYEEKMGRAVAAALAAEGVINLGDPESEPLHAQDVAQAFGMTVAEFIAPDTS